MQQIIKRNKPLAQYCPQNLKSRERRVKMSDLMLTYKIVFVGMAVAIAMFILELLSR